MARATPAAMKRNALFLAAGFALALVVVLAGGLIAARALGVARVVSGAPDASGTADTRAHATPADPDEAPLPNAAALDDDARDASLSGDDAQLTMNNVALVAAPGVTVDVVHMRGALRNDGEGNIDLEKPECFAVVIDDAEVRIRAAVLQKLAWQIDGESLPGLAAAKVALDRVDVSKGRITQEGHLDLAGLRVPFAVTGTLSATANGDVRVDVIEAHVGALDTLPLIEALDVDLRRLIKGKAPAVRGGEGLSLTVSLAAIDAKPRLVAKVRSVRIEDDVVVVRLRGAHAPSDDARHAPASKNTLVIMGGKLALGKMSMHGAVAELVDVDMQDPLMVDMQHFQKQLYASICRATPHGVRVHMVDANDVDKRQRGGAHGEGEGEGKGRPTGR